MINIRAGKAERTIRDKFVFCVLWSDLMRGWVLSVTMWRLVSVHGAWKQIASEWSLICKASGVAEMRGSAHSAARRQHVQLITQSLSVNRFGRLTLTVNDTLMTLHLHSDRGLGRVRDRPPPPPCNSYRFYLEL